MSTDTAINLLAELDRLEALRVPQAQGSRQFHRFPIRGNVELHPMEGTRVDRTPIDATLRDISLGGVGLVCAQALEGGTMWQCCFLERGHVFVQQALIVRHCREVQTGLHLIGGQFCIAPGVLLALGVAPHDLSTGNGTESVSTDENCFQSPGDME